MGNKQNRLHYHSANFYDDVEQLAQIARKATRHRPTIGVVCGSGLGKIAQMLEDQDVLPYENLPNFPVSTGKALLRQGSSKK